MPRHEHYRQAHLVVGSAMMMGAHILSRPRSAFALVLLFALLGSAILSGVSNAKSNPSEVVTLASGQLKPHGIVIFDEYVYWTDAGKGTVSRVPVEGGTVTILASGGSQPEGIAVDQDCVYWTDFEAGIVSKVHVTGGPSTILASQQDRPWSIIVAGGYVYWAEFLLGNIKRIPVNGGQVEYVVKGRFGVSGMAIYQDYMYWAEGSTQGADVSQIGRIPLADGAPTQLVKTVKPWSITIGANSLFWTRYRWGGVQKVSLSGGPIKVVEYDSIEDDDFMIASDYRNLYWTERRSGNIKSAPLTGGNVTILASDQQEPYAIATDGTHVVWTEASGGNVKLYDLPLEGTAREPAELYTQAVVGSVVIAAVVLVGVFAARRRRRRIR